MLYTKLKLRKRDKVKKVNITKPLGKKCVPNDCIFVLTLY